MEWSHDLSLPAWGPYNKNYLGCAHVADKKNGLRFEVRLFPGFFRRSAINPKTIVDGGVKMLASSADASHFIYRYELEWKDRIYCDADFSSEGEDCTVACEFVNNTDEPQVLNMNMFFSMELPSVYTRTIHPCRVFTEDGVRWIDAVDYSDIVSDSHLALDGLYLGEGRYGGFVGGSGIASYLFGREGHKLSYSFDKTRANKIAVRYISGEDANVTLVLDGKSYEATLPKSNGISLFALDLPEGEYTSLELLAHGGRFELDGFLLGTDLERARFEKVVPEFKPAETRAERAMTLDYTDLGVSYDVTWDTDDYQLRNFIGSNAPEVLTDSLHNHVSDTFYGQGEGFSKNLFLKPIFLEPHEKKSITVKVSAKRGAENNSSARDFIRKNCEHTLVEPRGNSQGDRYAFSQRLLSAVTLTNVVFPIYCRREYIRHNTPGRLWDSLYTWDSGMIGVGLSAISVERSKESLRAYLTPLGDKHSPFIFHGSVVPTQIFQFAEIWNKTRDEEYLREIYPNMLQYYRFFADLKDKDGQMKSGLLKMWDIFYNSGGWDDYPAQSYMHSRGLSGSTTSVISSAITVLSAKILKAFAAHLGFDDDVREFDEDIAFFSDALQKYAWDEESGYFGYVRHNENGEPVGIMRTDAGVNCNMGLDGVYPYIAGITEGKQSEILYSHMEKDMMTDYGMSVVDKNAPYYSTSGYWNGTIWMPHQWITWKSLLDHGKTDLANKMALLALDVFDTEALRTYNSYENYMVVNGRGAGFHQFSGLTSPVLDWYRAYFVPGSISGGFECFTKSLCYDADANTLSAELTLGGESPSLIVCMREGSDYCFSANGEEIPAEKLFDGTYLVKPQRKGDISLTVNVIK